MLTSIHITASAIIGHNTVYKNGKKILEQADTEVSDFLMSVYQKLAIQYPKFYKMDNLSKLGWLASEVLLQDGFNKSDYQPADIGVVLSNANSSLDTDIKYFETAKDIASPALFVYTLPNIIIGEICIRNGFKGENAFFVMEEFDAAFMLQYIGGLFNNNILQCCICGWVELLGEEYKTVLFLVEKKQTEESIIFTKENINKIYEIAHG